MSLADETTLAAKAKSWLFSIAVALQFMSRIPVPTDLNPNERDMATSAQWFPVVGLILGAILWLLHGLTLWIGIPAPIAVALILVAMTLLTGSFHEDGLADSCDGIYGGMDIPARLRIMRDSRLGTYGTVSLVTLYILRWTALTTIPDDLIGPALMVSLCLSRWTTLPLISSMPYARSTIEGGIAKPLIEGISKQHVLVATAIATLGAVLLTPGHVVPLLVAASICTYLGRVFCLRKLNGVTGDLLGAVNVVTEVACLILIASSSNT